MVRKEGQSYRNLRFPIHPTPEQELKLEETLETCRRLWNDLLSTRIELFHRDVNAAVNILKRSKTYQNTVRLAGINGCGIGAFTTSCLTGLQVPTINQQLLKLIRG